MRFQLAGCILVAVALGACNTPSVGFMGVNAQTVTVDGSTFDVRQKDGRAELIRTNPEAVFTLAGIVPRAAVAVEHVTGCMPINGTWKGDQAMMKVKLDCP